MELFRELKKTLQQGSTCVLCVIVEANGSTPRHQGSYMLVKDGKIIAGTVGGGIAEYQTLHTAEECLINKKSTSLYVEMGETKGILENQSVCGGSLFIRCIYLEPEKENELPLWLKVFCDFLDKQIPCYLLIPKSDGVIYTGTLSEWEKKKLHESDFSSIDLKDYYWEAFGTEGKVYLFGAGHVAKALVKLLHMLSFQVVVLDDREELLQQKIFVDSSVTKKINYEDFALPIKEHDYVVVATRGHQYDIEVLKNVLQTKACYIGVMGSRRKAQMVYEYLLQEGYPKETLSRMISPIGISIGSETPEEVAVSIAAQLIQMRRQYKL